jgi:hypothetical protein
LVLSTRGLGSSSTHRNGARAVAFTLTLVPDAFTAWLTVVPWRQFRCHDAPAPQAMKRKRVWTPLLAAHGASSTVRHADAVWFSAMLRHTDVVSRSPQ